jgi:hypothetical protein
MFSLFSALQTRTRRLDRSFQPESAKSEKYSTKLIGVCRAVPESNQPINPPTILQQKTCSTQNFPYPTTTTQTPNDH